MISSNLLKYFELEKKLFEIRERNNWEESEEEDNILDEMDFEYYKLTEEEIKKLKEPRTDQILVKRMNSFTKYLKSVK